MNHPALTHNIRTKTMFSPDRPLNGRAAASKKLVAPSIEQMRQDPEVWQRAARAWLVSKASPNARRAYQAALGRFLEFTGSRRRSRERISRERASRDGESRDAPPWGISGSDAIAWQDHRQHTDLVPTTISLSLAGLTHAINFCHK